MSEQALRRLRQTKNLDVGGGSSLRRFVKRPARVLLRKLLRPLYRQDLISFRTRTSLFWGEKMTVLVPEGLIYIRHGYYETDLTEQLLKLVTGGMTFIDIGAHFGYFSLLASMLVGDSGQVHAFEPTPRTFRILSENVGRKRNVIANQCAVFSSTSSINMIDLGPRFAGYNSFVDPRLDSKRAKSVKPRLLRVPTITLDEYTHDWDPRPLFIKIDAESAESEILKGMQQTLERLRPILAFEVGDFQLENIPKSRAIICQILEKGYAAYSPKKGNLTRHELRSTYKPGTIIALPLEHEFVRA